MTLPINPPVKPMLSKPVASLDKLPDGPLLYEPKWDGFRCIVFRDGDDVVLGSRNEKPLTRYFPEVVEAVRRELPERCVVDGEIVVAGGDGLDFDALQQRIHPADSRVRRLAEETPAAFVAFDLLALGDDVLMALPFRERRARLETALASVEPPIYLTPVSSERSQGADWFTRFEGAGLDGVIAKEPESTYEPEKRLMYKVKHHRTADCVVAGFRMHKDGKGVGSLLLGLFDDEGSLHHVGVCASFKVTFRAELVDILEPLRAGAADDHPWATWVEAQEEVRAQGARMPGGLSRWNAQKDLSWEPVRCERVIEVEYDQLQSGRFRRVARFIRWRDDRDPASCRYDQLEAVVPAELAGLFSRQ
jgi:ATP-dependent DNA ligase